jgi:lysophospholipase L1-like esterase
MNSKPLVLFFYVLLFLFPVYAQQLNNEKATTVKENVDKTQNPFEKEILAFEHQDSLQFPPKQAVLFVGSSSIRLWKTLADDFPELQVINRGFGGSKTADVLYYFDRIVKPYQPKTIVYFTGTNDLAGNIAPQQVVDNVEEFIKRVGGLFPETNIVVLSNTIAVSRKHLRDSYLETNRILQVMLRKYPKADFLDVTTPGLKPDGWPRPEIYGTDSLHLNATGYQMWKNLLRPVLLGNKQ